MFHYILDGGGFIKHFIDWIINNGGLYVLLLVIFAETGLFVGFLFPGDSLLFAAGIYVDDLARELFRLEPGAPVATIQWLAILAMVMVASIIGNYVAYWFGRKAGPLLYERKETWLFRRKHLVRASEFYDHYGKGTVFLAKFLPIIRTFAPIIAGMVKMSRPIFMLYNIIGSICWVASMMLGGHYLERWVHKKWDFSLKDHIEVITIVIILITTLPVLYKLFFSGKRGASKTDPPPSNL